MIFTEQVCHLPGTKDFSQVRLEELFGKILLCGLITKTDRQKLKTLILEELFTEDDHAIVNRLFYGIRRGFIQVVN